MGCVDDGRLRGHGPLRIDRSALRAVHADRRQANETILFQEGTRDDAGAADFWRTGRASMVRSAAGAVGPLVLIRAALYRRYESWFAPLRG